jgi:hypothetical protein
MQGMDAIGAALITAVLGGLILYFLGLQSSRRVRFEDRRDEVIAELSGLMYKVQDTYFHWSHLSLPPGASEEEIVQRHVEKAERAVRTQNELILYFYSNEDWLDPKTAARVEDFIRTVQSITQSHPPDLKNVGFALTPKVRTFLVG